MISSHRLVGSKLKKTHNFEGCNLDSLLKNHQFKSHKSQDYWRFTWLLISEPAELVGVHTN
jgi:hypothetical protein